MFVKNPTSLSLTRLLALLLVLLVHVPPHVASAQEVPAPPAALFRVMSFNIRYNNAGDGENAWPNRKRMVVSMIRFNKADLVGVQEALRGQLDDMQALLPEYAWVGVGRDDGKNGGEFSAIFYRKTRFALQGNSTFWLSDSPQTVGSKGWDAALPRVVTWAKFRDLVTGRSFIHFNTHFDHRGVQAREASASLILSEISKIGANLPVILTGDFNANEASAPYQIITGKAVAKAGEQSVALQDARYVSAYEHHGPTTTWNGFKAIEPGRKIDHIFVNNMVRVIQHGILSDVWDGRFPSDHLPVLAEVALK